MKNNILQTNQIKSESVSSSKSSPVHSYFFLLFLLTFVVRGAVLFASLSSFNSDPDDYLRLAENWYVYGTFGTQGQATAFRPPLYPWTLKELILLRSDQDRPRDQKSITIDGVNKYPELDENVQSGGQKSSLRNKLALSPQASIAFWHWILGIATVLIVYRLALLAKLSPQLSFLVGLCVAFDPILLQQSRLVMTETLATFFSSVLLLGTVLLLQKHNFNFVKSATSHLALGALFGLSTLCRPAFFSFVGLTFLGILLAESYDAFHGEKRPSQPRVLRFLAQIIVRPLFFVVGVVLLVAPWFARNLHEFGAPILTTTHGGYTLYLANNPEIYKHYQSSPAWSLWDPESFHKRRVVEYREALKASGVVANSKEAELFQDEWNQIQAQKTIVSQPKVFAYACVTRIGELWRVLPNEVAANQGDHKADLSSPTTIARYGIAAFYTVELLLALVGLVMAICSWFNSKNRGKVGGLVVFFGTALILSVQIPHLIYWTNMRMRAPLQAFIPILTAYGLLFVMQRFSQKSNNTNVRYNQRHEKEIV